MELPDSETRRNFYASFDKNEQAVAEDVKTIKTWLQSQTHHPEVMDDVKIRNILHLCKFRMDKTKEKIDNYYTFSSKHPSFFQDSNPKVDSLRDAMEKNYLCFHPKLLDNMHRLCFIKPKEKDTYVPASIVKLCFSMLEIMLQEDFMMHQTMVVDMSTLSFRDICKVSPKLLMTTFQVYKNIFSMRAHTVYLINSPSYITIWMTLFKFIFPAKIFNKFQVYKDSEILKERLPCDVLPVDYGGQGPSLEELTDLMKKKFAEYQERFDLLDTFRVERRS